MKTWNLINEILIFYFIIILFLIDIKVFFSSN
jgi:hypothetical protein